MVCNVMSNGDTLTVEVIPCHKPPAVSIVNVAIDGKVTLRSMLTNPISIVAGSIGGAAGYLNVTVVQHSYALTIGLEVSKNRIT